MLDASILELSTVHPQLDIDLTLSDERVDVVDEKIDIGIRIGFMRDSRFIVRQLAKINLYVVASPDLINRVGTPASIEDLNHLPVTGLVDRNTESFGHGFFPWTDSGRHP